MSRWWRAYDEAVDDPKLLLLSDRAHRAWFNLMCLASVNGGRLPERKVIELKLRLSPSKTEAVMVELRNAGLIDNDEAGSFPHNWNGRQYKSDVSTERVQRFRNAKRNVSVTPPETEADTESERKKDSGAIAPTAGKPKREKKYATALSDSFEPNWEAATRVGLSKREAEREFQKFKNHAAQTARSCVNWQAAWSNWCIKAAEFLGRPPPIGPGDCAVDQVFVASDSPAFEAWNQHAGKRHPTNRNGGWYFPTEWPPERQAS